MHIKTETKNCRGQGYVFAFEQKVNRLFTLGQETQEIRNVNKIKNIYMKRYTKGKNIIDFGSLW